MKTKVAVDMAPIVIQRCEKCKCPVVKQTTSGRFLVNGNVSIDRIDPQDLRVEGKCPRCAETFKAILKETT